VGEAHTSSGLRPDDIKIILIKIFMWFKIFFFAKFNYIIVEGIDSKITTKIRIKFLIIKYVYKKDSDKPF
jgi:hypothetical protein